ncbi:MAG: flagellar motor protein [Gammaproteobacteria bacterium]
MDILTVVGIVLALGAIAGGQAIEGGHLASLANLPAFVIVIGGTVGAIMLQAPMPIFKHALKRAIWVLLPPKVSLEETIAKIIEWSNIARKEGLLSLENLIGNESDPFTAKGLQMLVDGSEPDDIRHVLEVDLGVRSDLENQAAKLYEGMGGYAPTVGIIGAVMGLIHVMENLADPSKLGAGIASAFVATVYGVGAANLLFLPLANKLKSITHHQSQHGEMLIEGLVSIAQGENPRNVEAKLKSFAHH